MASTSTTQSSLQEANKYNDSIYKLYSPSCDPKAEILFFHDVLWKEDEEPHVQSWMSSSTPSVCWPEAWLKLRYPEARTLSVCYDGGVLKTDTAGHMDLFLLAENLRQDILQIYAGNCPIVLIGHGFGGLVIKAVIEALQNEHDALRRRVSDCEETRDGRNLRKLKCFLENVKAIFYFAPPFLGSKLADHSKNLPHRGSLLKFLEVLSSEISRLNEWFRRWRQDRGCKATAISASLPTEVTLSTRVLQTILQGLWYGLTSFHVVEEASSRFDVDHFYTSSRDHFGVCKLRYETDSSFHRLIELMDPIMVVAMTCGPTSPNDDGPKSACTQLVGKILKELAELEEGRGVWLKIEDLQKINKFPELRSDLTDGLKKAGLERTSVDGGRELWEP